MTVESYLATRGIGDQIMASKMENSYLNVETYSSADNELFKECRTAHYSQCTYI